jgi:O-antigen ligase
MNRTAFLRLTPTGVAVLSFGLAAMCGLLFAVRPAAGLAFAMALLFVPAAFLYQPIGLALWAPIPFVQFLPALWIGPTVAGLVILGAWLGADRVEARDRLRQLGSITGPLVLVGSYVAWVMLSASWSEADTATRNFGVLHAGVAAVVLVIFASSIRSEKTARAIAIGFVLGAVASVAIGLASVGLRPTSTAYESSTVLEGRLKGGSGDPNYLAAGLVPALAIIAGLAMSTRSSMARIGLLTGGAVIAIGLAASQSRGGFIAAIVAAAAAVAVMRRHRATIVGSILIAAAVMALWFSMNPTAWQRVIMSDGGGSGRTDLWTVALRMSNDNAVVGVGVGAFRANVAAYLDEPGMLQRVKLILERSQVAHNTYLQALSETGAVGLGLFVLAMGALLRLPYRAGILFERDGALSLATLSRTVFVAQLSGLVALFFLSFGHDQRLWLLFGLGAALYSLALQRTRASAGTIRP